MNFYQQGADPRVLGAQRMGLLSPGSGQGGEGGDPGRPPPGYSYVPTFGFVPTEDVPYYTSAPQIGGVDIPPADMSPGNFGTQSPSQGNAEGGPRNNYYGDQWNGLPPYLQGAPQSSSDGSPSDWRDNATSSAGNDYPAGRGGVNVPQYPAGRGQISSTSPQDSGNWFSRLADNLRGQLRGQFPDNLGGMTDPSVARQNNNYWSQINGPGLSNPSFYPGGGTTHSLQTPGGTPFNPGGSGQNDFSSFFGQNNHPLSVGAASMLYDDFRGYAPNMSRGQWMNQVMAGGMAGPGRPQPGEINHPLALRQQQ